MSKHLLYNLNSSLVNIIKGCQHNKTIAQKELYECFATKMFGVCLRYSNNEHDAQDILQDGFLKIFQKIGQYQFKGSFEGWIRRIMVNTALERYRQQYKIINIQDTQREIVDENYEDVTDALTSEELLKMVQDLSPKYRMVFNMYAIEGYSHKEIADKLGITEGTSKSNLSRARTILQEKVKIHFGSSIKIGI